MKVLDVQPIDMGISKGKTELAQLQTRLEAINKAVTSIVQLQEVLKGEMGQSIRNFYSAGHLPIIRFLHKTSLDYEHKLKYLRDAVSAFEPDVNGLIDQGFIENEVQTSLRKMERKTCDMTDRANQVISSVQDIVPLTYLDESRFVDSIRQGEKKTRDVLERLHDLDRQLLQSLKPLEEALTLASEYIESIGQVIASGNNAVEKFDIGEIQNVEAYDRLRSTTDPIYLGKQLLKKVDPRIFSALARLLFPITFKDTGKPKADKSTQLKKVAEENQMSASEEEAIRQYLLSGVKKDPSEFEADGFTVKSSLTDSQSARIANDTRVGINGGYFNMLGGIVTYGVPKAAMATGDFFFGDVVTMVHPDSTMKDRSTAAVFTFVKPAKVLSKLQLNKARRLVGKGTVKSPSNFADHAKLEGHFDKHGKEFDGLYKNADEYLEGAKEVIKNGIQVKYEYKGEIRTGYVNFMGNNKNGKAKFEFVGTNNNGDITTYHTQSGKKIWKTLNGENIPVINPAE
ncbi:LXG domain-containing protein [Aciduricibacillus chroicocephali]|uniref:LXG domain-containing protein n=1 Tax=Aciduricibacillus chroicocephali TaxID=3054939 RepID=A0ABY9KY26_9BACI|nr:LXG domain-containing protein [Bacillaceae bacterium 44XB]